MAINHLSANSASLELSLLPPPPPPLSVAPAQPADWNPQALFCLIDFYGRKFSEGRGLVRTKDWEGVVLRVNSLLLQPPKTLKQCRDKMDGLKRRYKRERRRAIVEGGFSNVTWPYFNSMDLVMNSVLRPGPLPSPSPPPPLLPPLLPPHATAGTTDLSSLSPPGKSTDSPEQLEAESLQNRVPPPPRRQPIPEPSHQSRGRVDSTAFLVVNKGHVKKVGMDSRNPSLARSHRPFKKRPLHTRDSDDTLPGFPQLYASIEHSKAEILSMIELEMATLNKKYRKKSGSGLYRRGMLKILHLYAGIEYSKTEILSTIDLEMAKLHKKKSRKNSGSGLASTVPS